MKISAHDWRIKADEDKLRITVVYNDKESSTIVLNKDFDVLNNFFTQKAQGLIEGVSFGSESILYESNISDLDIKQPTEYIPTCGDFSPKIDYDKVNDLLAPKHTDRYGKELKVGDRIYLEEGQEAKDLTDGRYWSSAYIKVNDCFTILEIGNKQTMCDWNVLDETGNKILTSELNKFTKI